MHRSTILGALATLLAALAVAAPARAAGPALAVADDRIMFGDGPTADQAVAQWRAAGIDSVRMLVLWSRVAPRGRAGIAPPGFDGANPNDRRYRWAPLDAAVARAHAAGLSVILTVTGPGPLWTSSAPDARDRRFKPRADLYAQFARAVALRYGDRVASYVLWNEPNLDAWLSPQASCSRRGCTPVSPHVYRGLVRAAYPAIKRVDPTARVLIGATSSRGATLIRPKTGMRPLEFLRNLGCVSDRYRRLRAHGCRRFRPARADGYAFHPHGILSAPDEPFPNRDDVNLVSIRRLTATLDRLQRARRLRSSTRRIGVYIDEYGYQTRPPDRYFGISLHQQDVWLQRAAYIAWQHPRVRLFAQYLWRDEPGVYGGWQSGVYFTNGRAKPIAAHFRTPFVVDARRNRLWGQVRPGRAARVVVQRRPRGSRRWRRLATRRTDARGYWTLRRRLVRGTAYRFRAHGLTSQVVHRP